MYIANIHIKNYRGLKDHSIEFNQGINVIIGENNAGKTTILKALGLIFDSSARRRLNRYDFYQGIEDIENPPSITISVKLRSSRDGDTIDDKALVATWLTKLDSPWEAKLTYKYFLPEEEVPKFKDRIGTIPTKSNFWKVLELYIPKYIYRIYAGESSAQIKVEPEWLNKFEYQFLDAIRDVESELFSGSNPLLKSMLLEVLDSDLTDDEEGNKEKDERIAKFSKSSNILKRRLINRLKLESLFALVKQTGARDGGEPTLGGTIIEQDIIASLRLFIKSEKFELPADYNGLGYNNLVYISLVLANLDFKTSIKQRGQNAAMFPILIIEEPEAHLHPALQYKLLKYIDKRIKTEKKSRQIFITTHSTHITSACSLEQIICMSIDNGSIGVSYPGKVFGSDPGSRKSKKYVERYLDSTKSNMLFSKGIVFVEGLAEQILLPCIAEYINCPLEENHVAVIGVGGSTFKHFLPIFGAVSNEEVRNKYSLRRRIACLVDADPSKKKKDTPNARWTGCWPYEYNSNIEVYEYKAKSSVVENLNTMCSDISDKIKIYSGTKTLEYDIALENSLSHMILTSSCTHKQSLETFIDNKDQKQDVFESQIDEDSKIALDNISEDGEQQKARFATYYLMSIDSKGENAFDLERALRENLEKEGDERKSFQRPAYISDAIKWACGFEIGSNE